MNAYSIIVKLCPKYIKKIVNSMGWHPLQDLGWKRRASYEPQTGFWMKRIVEPGWICVDVGANIGIITDRLASYVGRTGKVVAFEPHPENFKRLKKYNKKNICAGLVIAENMAVTDGLSGSVWLYPGRNNSGGEWNIRGCDINDQNTEPTIRVPATSLDMYFSDDKRVHLIKIDVEGAGEYVLAGAKRLLKKYRPIVFMEFHTAEEWRARYHLLSEGYKIYDLNGRLLLESDSLKREYLCFALPFERDIL